MGFGEAVKTCFNKYVTFSGRAKRPEFWWFYLFVVLGSVATGLIDGVVVAATGMQVMVVNLIFSLATFLPLLAAQWRRMHDIGKPGYMNFLPIFGVVVAGVGFAAQSQAVLIAGVVAMIALSILVIVWLASRSEKGANAFGAGDEMGDVQEVFA